MRRGARLAARGLRGAAEPSAFRRRRRRLRHYVHALSESIRRRPNPVVGPQG
jgi:hypothetical protein